MKKVEKRAGKRVSRAGAPKARTHLIRNNAQATTSPSAAIPQDKLEAAAKALLTKK